MAKVVAKKNVRTKKVAKKRNVYRGIVHIQSTFNNTIVTITDIQGNVLSWASAGTLGFKGSRKSTPFAAQTAAESASKVAMESGLKSVEVFVKGAGSGREAAIRAVQSAGLEIIMIKVPFIYPTNVLKITFDLFIKILVIFLIYFHFLKLRLNPKLI